MFYVGGVFHSTTPEWIINGLAKPEWVHSKQMIRKKLIILSYVTVGVKKMV